MRRVTPEGSQLVIDPDLLVLYIATNNRCFQLGNMRLLGSSQLGPGRGQYGVDAYSVGIGSHRGSVNVCFRGNGSSKKINRAKEQCSAANYNNLLFVQTWTI